MEIIEAFNEGGKSKAEKLVQEKYGKHYHIVQRNIAKNTGYSYSRHTKKYELINTKEEQFLTLEELCDTPKHSSKIEEYTTRKDTSLDLGIVSDSFKELVLNLMKKLANEWKNDRVFVAGDYALSKDRIDKDKNPIEKDYDYEILEKIEKELNIYDNG